MCDVVDQAKAALLAYLERGERALKAFCDGRSDLVLRRLAWRNGAFARFKRLDAEATSRGIALGSDPGLVALWQGIREQNLALQAAIEKSRVDLNNEWLQRHSVRQVMGKFRSGSQRQVGFQSTI